MQEYLQMREKHVPEFLVTNCFNMRYISRNLFYLVTSYKVSLASGANPDMWQSQHFKLDVYVPGVYYTHNYYKLHMWKCPGLIHYLFLFSDLMTVS